MARTKDQDGEKLLRELLQAPANQADTCLVFRYIKS
jgi:hypothetical protein